TICDHADQSVVLSHRQHSGVDLRHKPRGIANCLVRVGDLDVAGHCFVHLHGMPPHKFKSALRTAALFGAASEVLLTGKPTQAAGSKRRASAPVGHKAWIFSGKACRTFSTWCGSRG